MGDAATRNDAAFRYENESQLLEFATRMREERDAREELASAAQDYFTECFPANQDAYDWCLVSGDPETRGCGKCAGCRYFAAAYPVAHAAFEKGRAEWLASAATPSAPPQEEGRS